MTSISKMFPSKKTSTNELAWAIKDTISILEYIGSKGLIVLGGDILSKELNYTYDSWFYNVDTSKDIKYNLVQSIQLAIEYISSYMQKNGDNYYVIIVTQH